MKRRGPELGQLSSKFFAYVQLKKKDTLRTGELAPVLGIDESQERDLLRRLSAAGWIVRLKRGVYLVPPRIPPGGRHSPGLALILQKLMEEGGGRYQICGPAAFNFYGLDDQIPGLIHVYNDRISGTRTIGNLAFQFIRVSRERLGATETVRTREGGDITYYSSKVRTLMDAVYNWSRFNSLPRGYGWIRQEIAKDPNLPAALIDLTAQYGNKATIRRIGYLLDVVSQPATIVNRLRRLLSDSKALIPWIPGIPARGKVVRKWGVIVNG